MFKKILIANRGEVATRIIRACKELGIKTVAIYSEADVNSLHVKKADEEYLIHGDPTKAYLNYYKIVDIAKRARADAIHPGYGFLSERPDFARYCRQNGIEFIGPDTEHLRIFGDKIESKKLMESLGVPVAKGSKEPIDDIKKAKEIANEIGYPVMVKAAYGGGGRGLRLVKSEDEIEEQFNIAVSEAKASFGKGEVFIEKFIERPRHIEIQVVADKYGNVAYLGERDCSLQRRNQKVVEVSPSPVLTRRQREKLGDICVKAAKSIGYYGLGTWEFLMDRYGNFYFMEVNPRLQVEHTVSERVTGIDLVQEQIRIASNMELSFSQRDVNIHGYAFQFRINAEDPTNNFMPVPGTITSYYSPGGIGIRMDGVVYKGYEIPPYYDSMVGKLIVWGRTWDETIRRARRALDEFVIRGVPTTIPFFRKLVRDPEFIKGQFDTSFIDRKTKDFTFTKEPDPETIALAVSAAIAAHHGL